jgi:histone-binding protein RBBP4
VLVTADISKPRVSAAEHITPFADASKSPNISAPLKTLFHPGEVNKITDLPHHPSIIITHTDAPHVLLWNFDTQPDRAGAGCGNPAMPSTADLVLEGHEQNAEFALATSTASPLVSSGGKDCNVLLWNVGDHASSLSSSSGGSGWEVGGPGTKLAPHLSLKGHTKTVEDLAFRPGSAVELASCGDDYKVCVWGGGGGVAGCSCSSPPFAIA